MDACNNIRKWLEQYRQDNAFSPVTPAVKWDAAKVIRGQLTSYASAKKNLLLNKQNNLRKSYPTWRNAINTLLQRKT